MMATLAEIMLLAEHKLERRLCGLAICQPKVIALSKIRPEVEIGAIAFFKEFEKRIPDILAADELTAIKIALLCCKNYRDFWNFFTAIDNLNTFEVAPNYGAELIAARTARKAIHWVETSGILEEAKYDG